MFCLQVPGDLLYSKVATCFDVDIGDHLAYVLEYSTHSHFFHINSSNADLTLAQVKRFDRELICCEARNLAHSSHSSKSSEVKYQKDLHFPNFKSKLTISNTNSSHPILWGNAAYGYVLNHTNTVIRGDPSWTINKPLLSHQRMIYSPSTKEIWPSDSDINF